MLIYTKQHTDGQVVLRRQVGQSELVLLGLRRLKSSLIEIRSWGLFPLLLESRIGGSEYLELHDSMSSDSRIFGDSSSTGNPSITVEGGGCCIPRIQLVLQTSIMQGHVICARIMKGELKKCWFNET